MRIPTIFVTIIHVAKETGYFSFVSLNVQHTTHHLANTPNVLANALNVSIRHSWTLIFRVPALAYRAGKLHAEQPNFYVNKPLPDADKHLRTFQLH